MADPKQLRSAACDAGSKGHIHWQEYMADAADQIERLQAAAAANICCPECEFTGPAKDWEITTPEGQKDG